MAEILLFHHALGLTPGCLAFAEDLRAAGHVVHTPDLYDGRTFATLDDGVGYAQRLGFNAIIARGEAAAGPLSQEIVYAGFSLGVMPAQKLAQTRAGARGALLLHSVVPLAEFGGRWPAGLALQIHTMADDLWGDVEVARAIAATVEDAQLFLYPGDRHLFTDSSLPDYDEDATTLVMQRVMDFLDDIEEPT